MSKGMPFGKSFPQGDTTASRRKVPRTGPDDNAAMKVANGSATAPKLPDRDGPAKEKVGGKMMGKPKTSAPAGKAKKFAAMKASLKAMK